MKQKPMALTLQSAELVLFYLLAYLKSHPFRARFHSFVLPRIRLNTKKCGYIRANTSGRSHELEAYNKSCLQRTIVVIAMPVVWLTHFFSNSSEPATGKLQCIPPPFDRNLMSLCKARLKE